MEASHQVTWLKLHIINDLPTSWLVYWQPEDLHWPNHIHLSVNRIPKVPTNHSARCSATMICMVSCICFHSMYIIGSPTFTRLHFYRLVLVAVADFLSELQCVTHTLKHQDMWLQKVMKLVFWSWLISGWFLVMFPVTVSVSLQQFSVSL